VTKALQATRKLAPERSRCEKKMMGWQDFLDKKEFEGLYHIWQGK